MPNSPVEVRSEVVPFMTEDRLAIQSMARDFAMKEVLPVANELDPVAGEIPMELRAKMAELASSASSSPRSTAAWASASPSTRSSSRSSPGRG